MTTRDEIAREIREYMPGTDGESDSRVIAEALMPPVRRAQAEALREFAADLDRYVGTILNAESAANIARVKANGIEKEGAEA